MKQFLSRFPLLALGLSLLAVGVWLVPGAAEVFQYDRMALAGGELWRAVAGHWAHWSADHLVWDLAMFAVFGALLERRSRARFAAVIGLSAAAIPVVLWFAAPEFEYYRGLSGIDSALFAAFFAQLLRDAWRSHSWLTGAVPVVALLGFMGKSAFELLTGSTVFVSDGAFTAVPLAHLVGAVVGMAVGVGGGCFSAARRPAPGSRLGPICAAAGVGVLRHEQARALQGSLLSRAAPRWRLIVRGAMNRCSRAQCHDGGDA